MNFCQICGQLIQPDTPAYCRQDLLEIHKHCGENILNQPGYLHDRPGELRRWINYIRENELFQAILKLDCRAPSYVDEVLKVVKEMQR